MTYWEWTTGCGGLKKFWRGWKADKETNQADYRGYPIMGGFFHIPLTHHYIVK